MAELVKQRLPKNNVWAGNLAVTVGYADGHELQVLPAIRTKAGYRIADPTRNEWSRVLHPGKICSETDPS